MTNSASPPRRAEAMKPSDIIDGATVRDRPNLYVVGCFDQRVTFYSQQVRGLSLVYALKEQGYLDNDPRIAIIGAGAAGLAAAAAAALASNGRVVIFETAADLLPLQSGTTRRKLDPHIYDWPCDDAVDKIANLPILDWEAGPARSVRDDVVLEFEDISQRMGGRLEKRLRHQVTRIRPEGRTYEITFDRLGAVTGAGPAQALTERFDIVLLAIGFGLEPNETIPGILNSSYWSDSGVPTQEFAARPTPRFFISGNGDGALIDLVAAAASDFDHAEMIRLIVGYTGIGEIAKVLVDIDARGRQALVARVPFDLFAVYETEIQHRIEANGLLREVGGRLRAGVRLTLQTNNPDIFSLNTSALNRLAAFVTIKACEATTNSVFTHVRCSNVTRDQEFTTTASGQPVFLLDCEGTSVEADEVIIRRGPQSAEVRSPFSDMLVDYATTHAEWLSRHGNATLVPDLSREARAFFEGRANEEGVPLSRRRQRQAEAALPISFQLRAVGEEIRWTGGLAKETIADAWENDRAYQLILPSGPSEMGTVTGAILRMACHARQVVLYADPIQWRDVVRHVSSDSPHASGMSMVSIVSGSPGGAAQNPELISAGHLARQLHRSLDRWVLEHVHAHLDEFLRSVTDPQRMVGISIAADLRLIMSNTWRHWRESFELDGDLLNRFLRLMVCAIDDEDLDAAKVLVGPRKLQEIIRGTAVSLAIAASWQLTSPAGTRPGNLRRQRHEAPEWSGHGCAANLINRKALALCAGTYMWQTNFVILAVEGLIELSKAAESQFTHTDSGQPAFSETDGSGPVVMWITQEFSDAAEAGAAEFAAMLAKVETRHFSKLASAIERAGAAA